MFRFKHMERFGFKTYVLSWWFKFNFLRGSFNNTTTSCIFGFVCSRIATGLALQFDGMCPQIYKGEGVPSSYRVEMIDNVHEEFADYISRNNRFLLYWYSYKKTGVGSSSKDIKTIGTRTNIQNIYRFIIIRILRYEQRFATDRKNCFGRTTLPIKKNLQQVSCCLRYEAFIITSNNNLQTSDEL